jgi:hypothetical protein
MGSSVNSDWNRLILVDCTLLAGNVPWPVEDQTQVLYADFQKPDELDSIKGGFERTPWYANPSFIYDTEYVKQNMTPGSRYVFVIRLEPLLDPRTNYGPNMFLHDQLTEPWCGAVWPLDGAPDDYLDTDKFAPFKELVELTNADAHTFDMVYTDDMCSILRFA